MTTPLTQLIEEFQKRAQTCETATEDAAQEALTDEASKKERHANDAREWKIKSEVWQEAEAVARALLDGRQIEMSAGARRD